MNAREQGFLLLCGYLGDSARKPLTVPQLRRLAQMAHTMERPANSRNLEISDLTAIGCEKAFAKRVIELLSKEELLQQYLVAGRSAACTPLTRISQAYPDRLRKALGMDAPGALWLKGDSSLLSRPMISVVGSRDLHQDNYVFAEAIGRQAARRGYVLVSGNARGADRVAQDSCLRNGGSVISVVADELLKQRPKSGILYISEEGFDLPFSANRALQRNRIIHSLSSRTFVVQCTLGKGGTWSGSCHNLRNHYSQVFCYNDGSDAVKELVRRGAVTVSCEELEKIC